MMRVHRMRFVLPVPLLLACFVTIASPDFASAQNLDSLMDGFRSERELFRSGRYRMTGTFKREGATADCKMAKPQAFSGFVAVDHDARLFRVDSVWPVCTDLNGQVDFIQMSKRCAFTVTESMGTGQPAGIPDRRMINVWQAGKLGGSSNPVYSDVRMCGATNLVGLRRCLPTFPNSPFERFTNSPSIYPEVKISKAPGGLTRIELFKKGKIDLRRKIWINESRGFTIERSEFSYRDMELMPPVDCLFISRASWQKINDAWVPVSFSADETTDQEKHLEAKIVWESVNTPVDPLLFTVAGLSKTPDTQVVDVRSGKPVLIQK
jgi:hypothetical protein